MKPILFLDTSALLALSSKRQEMVRLEQHFTIGIVPHLILETLSKIAKEGDSNRELGRVISSAKKLLSVCPKYNLHFLELLKRELCGEMQMPMNSAQLYRDIQMYTESKKKGVVWGKIFQDWEKETFYEEDHRVAKICRTHSQSKPLEEMYTKWEERFPGTQKPETFEEIKEIVDRTLVETNQEEVLSTGLDIFFTKPDYNFPQEHDLPRSYSVSQEEKEQIITRWKESGCPPIKEFAPYFFYLYSVLLFGYTGIDADLINRKSNNILDIMYVYYLPFCTVFSSGDRFHETLFSVFSREDQFFVFKENSKKNLEEFMSVVPLIGEV